MEKSGVIMLASLLAILINFGEKLVDICYWILNTEFYSSTKQQASSINVKIDD
jgi:pyruvate/2-oxoacid:ferredoxin oxidoreductase beta subunit